MKQRRPPQHFTIRYFPDACLRTKAKEVVEYGEPLRQLVARMTAVLKQQKHGIGIAAPQLGIDQAVAIVDVSSRMPQKKPLILINPKVISGDGLIPSKEGCMSVPDYTGLLQRYRAVNLRWRNLEGALMSNSYEGLEAVCIQHEVDHLNGVLIIDRVDFNQRQTLLSDYRRL